MKVLVYDANNFLHVAGAGQESHAGMVSMFVRAVTAINANMKADNFLFMWDGGIAGWRRELMPGYKVKPPRKPEDEERFKKAKMATMKVIEFMGASQMRVDGVEADDLISVLSCEVANVRSDMEIVVVSTDKDFYQIVGPRISIYDPVKKRNINEKNFLLITEGMSRGEYAAYRAMVGDSSDRIPGVKGIGEKGAGAIIRGSATCGLKLVDDLRGALTEHSSDALEQFKTACRVMELPKTLDNLDENARGLLDEVIKSAVPRGKRLQISETKFTNLVAKLGLEKMYGENLFEFLAVWRLELV